MTDENLEELIAELAASQALDLRSYKRTTIKRRLKRRMGQLGVGNFEAYRQRLRDDPAEAAELFSTVLINVTEFFRDQQGWHVMRTEVLPRLLDDLQSGETFRAWCAGCSTGEEPYSLAMLLQEELNRREG